MFKFLFLNINFVYFAIANLIMQIGIGLTQVAVYGHLAKVGASPLYFTMAFSFSVIPGIFSSQLSCYLAKKVNIIFLCILFQLFGAFSLFLPLLGISNNYVLLIVFAEFISAFIMGFCYPISQIYVKRVFTDKNYLPLAAKLDVYLFSINIILGTFIGTLLYNYFSTKNYLILNILMYLISALLFLNSYYKNKLISIKNSDNYKNNEEIKNKSFIKQQLLFFRNFSEEQKYSFLILIFLPIVTTPAISLLPTIGNKYGTKIFIFGIILTPALGFILAKTIGQIMGPMLISGNQFEKLFKSKFIFLSCNFIFLFIYLVIYFIENIYLSIFLIILAHLFSNIVFSLGMFAVQRTFELKQILDVTTKQYQISTIAIAFIALLSGYLIHYIPYYVVIFSPYFIIFFILIFSEKNIKNKIIKSRKIFFVK
ncbi:MFS transporter [Pigmentibacter ruber]|uniref:MFS transporter n=1 Tax=Pigmentibacter ruber TaxID=2683196 RepID=UPI00131A9999|nr:MFS transporter [Pigmentibacter ruber]